MTVHGPPFYDETEWEPDGLTIHEILRSHAWIQGMLLSPSQLHILVGAMQQEHGQGWKAPFKAFVDEFATVYVHTMETALQEITRTFGAMAQKVDACEAAMPPKPPKNGPQYNPHARRGKGGRRR